VGVAIRAGDNSRVALATARWRPNDSTATAWLRTRRRRITRLYDRRPVGPFDSDTDTDVRLPECLAAGLRPSVRPNRVLVALTRCAEATMDASRWQELAIAISDEADEWVRTHPRLLRSLRFNDDDYGACVLSFFRNHLGDRWENLTEVIEHLDLREWLRSNDVGLYRELYADGVATPTDDDLAHLPDARAIRENLDRLNRLIEDGDHAAVVGTAKDLMESTARLVLDAAGTPASKTEDLPALIKRTHTALKVHAGEVTGQPAAVTAAVRRIRSGLQTAALGVVELRNEIGTGHGRMTPSPSGFADDARLAADAAAGWIRAMLSTLGTIGRPDP
jgi:AbiJ N-terminal domain 5/Abortive infection C-terminus